MDEKVMRYFAVFKKGNMELENESDVLVEMKEWVTRLLAGYPDPDYICIRDEDRDVVIFTEEGSINEEDDE